MKFISTILAILYLCLLSESLLAQKDEVESFSKKLLEYLKEGDIESYMNTAMDSSTTRFMAEKFAGKEELEKDNGRLAKAMESFRQLGRKNQRKNFLYVFEKEGQKLKQGKIVESRITSNRTRFDTDSITTMSASFTVEFEDEHITISWPTIMHFKGRMPSTYMSGKIGVIKTSAVSEYKSARVTKREEARLEQEPRPEPLGKVFEYVEVMPSFPNGKKALEQFLEKNIDLPAQLLEVHDAVTVPVRFVVNVDGSLDNIKVLKSAGFAFDYEAKRMILLMPKWNPGIQNGEKVRCQVDLLVEFNKHKKLSK